MSYGLTANGVPIGKFPRMDSYAEWHRLKEESHARVLSKLGSPCVQALLQAVGWISLEVHGWWRGVNAIRLMVHPGECPTMSQARFAGAYSEI